MLICFVESISEMEGLVQRKMVVCIDSGTIVPYRFIVGACFYWCFTAEMEIWKLAYYNWIQDIS